MTKEIISLKEITTREISINNRTPIGKNVSIQVEITRKTKKSGKTLCCLLTAVLYRESEKDTDEKSFYIRYVLEGVFDILPKQINREEISNLAMIILHPFLRAQIASVLSSASIDTIIIPTYTID